MAKPFAFLLVALLDGLLPFGNACVKALQIFPPSRLGVRQAPPLVVEFLLRGAVGAAKGVVMGVLQCGGGG